MGCLNGNAIRREVCAKAGLWFPSDSFQQQCGADEAQAGEGEEGRLGGIRDSQMYRGRERPGRLAASH